jgi:transposase
MDIYVRRASIHTAVIAYLMTMVNVRPGWPTGSPDLNPTENIWAILKRPVKELGPETKEELIDVIITAWQGIEKS